MKVTYYYQYSHNLAEHFGLPLAHITTRHLRVSDNNHVSGGATKRIQNADKVWVQVDDEPIRVLKSRSGNMEFDQDEFTRMLFVAEAIEYDQ
jgi:hypothetical protein